MSSRHTNLFRLFVRNLDVCAINRTAILPNFIMMKRLIHGLSRLRRRENRTSRINRISSLFWVLPLNMNVRERRSKLPCPYLPVQRSWLNACEWGGRLKLILHSDHFLILGVSGSPKLDCEHGSLWKLNIWRTNYYYSGHNARNVQATSHLQRQESRNPHMGNFICWKHDIEAY